MNCSWQIDVIQTVVCSELRVDLDEVLIDSREGPVVFARHCIFYFLRKYTPLSLSDIGVLFRRNHSTVLHGVNAIRDGLRYDRSLRPRIEALESVIEIYW